MITVKADTVTFSKIYSATDAVITAKVNMSVFIKAKANASTCLVALPVCKS